MNLRRRIAAMEEMTKSIGFSDGPISLTEAVSGRRDERERRRLGRDGVRAAVAKMRELFERLRRNDDEFPDGMAGAAVPVLS